MKYSPEENNIFQMFAAKRNYTHSLKKQAFKELKKALLESITGKFRPDSAIRTKYYEICRLHANPKWRKEKYTKTKLRLNKNKIKTNEQTIDNIIQSLQKISTRQKERESLIVSLTINCSKLAAELEDCKNELRALKKLREAIDEYRSDIRPNLRKGIIL